MIGLRIPANFVRSLGAVIVVLFACLVAAPAQDTSVLDRLREMEQSQYPDFVGATPVPTPVIVDIDIETTPVIVGESKDTTASLAAAVSPQVLAADLESTVTWTQTRQRVDPGMEDLRLLLLSGPTADEVDKQIAKIETDLDLILRMAPFQAPNQESALGTVRRRIGRQLEILGEDYAVGELRRLPTTDELLRKSFSEWSDILVEADAERGLPSLDSGALPPAWANTSYSLPNFAKRLPSWPTTRLIEEYAERQQSIRVRLRRKPEAWDLNAAVEMGEIARQLATRVRDVPVASRKPFQNSALRLDVLSEALFQYMKAGDYLHAKRHLRVTEQALGDCRKYLELREKGL